MRNGAKSVALSRRTKRKGSTLGRRLLASLKEALAHARGETELPNYEIAVPRPVNRRISR